MKTVFTTGEAAEICKVSQQTIIRCFDSGRLKGFRVPGSRFRRIPRDALIAFMKENGIPIDALDNGKRKVLVVDDDPEIVELFVDVLERDGRFEVKTASSGYDAGVLTHEFMPDLVILDYLQLMSGGIRTENRVQEVSYISRNMKMLARELNVPVLAAAQLSRAIEQRADKEPQLSDLRESGRLEQDADIRF
jgi:excisionase family DNA binding protein